MVLQKALHKAMWSMWGAGAGWSPGSRDSPAHCGPVSTARKSTGLPGHQTSWKAVEQHLLKFKIHQAQDFPGSPPVKTSPSNAGGAGSISG